MSIDILAFGAHPDDVEIGAAGTIIKHVRIGKKIVICDLTLAELSSNGDVETRQKEAHIASEKMGLFERLNLGIGDRNIEITPETIQKVVEIIRKYKPTVVLAPYWQDRHPDHVHCSQLIQEAVFSAGIRKFASEAGEAHKVSHVYFYFINDFVDPDFCIDVSDCYEDKVEVLKAYESQFMSRLDRVDTPLNNGYIEMVGSRDYLFAKRMGTGYAEGFKTRLPLRIDSLC